MNDQHRANQLERSADSDIRTDGTMLAAVYRARGSVVLERLPIPRPGPGELLVQVRRCGVCPTDLKKIMMGLQPPPRVFGHEISGVVAEVGVGVTNWSAGDRVAVFHHVPCGTCHYCRNGSSAQCPQYKRTGTLAGFEPAGGGFAEFVLVRDWIVRGGVVALPDNVEFDEAALLEPLATCLKAVRRTGIGAGMTAVVVGQGPVGLMLTGILSHVGAQAIAIEPREDRAAQATAFGAHGVLPTVSDDVRVHVMDATDGRGADVVFLTVPASVGLPMAAQIVRAGGIVLFFADTYMGDDIHVDPGLICYREVTLMGSYSSDMTLVDEAAELLFGQPAHWRQLVSHVLPLSQIHAALELASAAPTNTLKVLVAP